MLWLTAASVPVLGQSTRSMPAVSSLEEFRPVGDMRVWTFFGNDSTFGKLISEVKATAELDGQSCIVIHDLFKVDFTKIRGLQNIDQTREFATGFDGTYLSDQIETRTDERTESFVLKRVGNRLKGSYTRAGKQRALDLNVARRLMAWDNNYVDQLELWVATRDIRVNEDIVDSIFQPQTLAPTLLAGRVYDFDRYELYQGRFDSVFHIHLNQPVQADLYVTPDHRLVKVDFNNLNYRVYQDIVRNTRGRPATTEKATGGRRPFSLLALIAMLPHYLFYLAVAAITTLLFAANAFRWRESYLAYTAGLVLYGIAVVTQIPAQKYAALHWVAGSVATGGSLYLAGVIPPLIAGVLQTAFLLGGTYGVIRLRSISAVRSIVAGAFLGAGFGCFEACYAVGLNVIPLFSGPLIERSFLIAYQVSAGALLGWMLGRRSGFVSVLLSLLLLNTLLRYLPVLVQTNAVEVGIMYFVLAVIVLIFVTTVLMVMKRSGSSIHGST